MHHILGNKILEYDVDDRGVIIDEREYDAATYNKNKDDLDYYGISFTYEQVSSARTRTGIADYHKNLPIQSKMKGCTVSSDNSTANRTVFIGCCLGYSSSAGWFSLQSSYGLGNSSAAIGCRLVYLP